MVGTMELAVKLIILCVIFTYVLAVEQVYNDSSTSETPQNLTTVADETAARMNKYFVDCTEETKINPNTVRRLRAGKWRQALRKQSPLLKKWTLCVLVKADMMSPDGVLKQDVVLANIPEKDRTKAEQAINKCLYKNRHVAFDTAWHYISCFRSKLPKYSII